MVDRDSIEHTITFPVGYPVANITIGLPEGESAQVDGPVIVSLIKKVRDNGVVTIIIDGIQGKIKGDEESPTLTLYADNKNTTFTVRLIDRVRVTRECVVFELKGGSSHIVKRPGAASHV